MARQHSKCSRGRAGREVLLTSAWGPQPRPAGGTGHAFLHSSSSRSEPLPEPVVSRGHSDGFLGLRLLQMVGAGPPGEVGAGRRSGRVPRVRALGQGCPQPSPRTGTILELHRAKAEDDGQARP